MTETINELIDREALCQYCPISEELQGIHCYGGEPIMCEGSHCTDAYERYLEEYQEEVTQ